MANSNTSNPILGNVSDGIKRIVNSFREVEPWSHVYKTFKKLVENKDKNFQR